MNNNHNYLVRVFFNDAIKTPRDPCIQLGITFAARNFSPLLLFAHLNNFRMILVGLYSKEPAFPITQMNFT